jgi:hypothetical protein
MTKSEILCTLWNLRNQQEESYKQVNKEVLGKENYITDLQKGRLEGIVMAMTEIIENY